MKARQIDNGMYWVGAVDWDRRLFDSLIPLPDGTSYNAYLIQGSDKTALIDSVDPAMKDVLFARLDSMEIKRLDYVVANHAEQDHSGTIPEVLARFPEARVLATAKCKAMLMDLLPIPESRIVAVQDGESISLGDRTLNFIHFPWVHWPETMLTWLPEMKTLFPCDLFGSHLATSKLFAGDDANVLACAKRYYAEIMMPFRNMIEKSLSKVTGLDIAMIAPSHGPIYNKPQTIIEAYREWMSGRPKNLVVLPYISMHESTHLMVRHLVEALCEKGVDVEQFNLSDYDVGKLAMSLVDAATIVLGSPTVLAGPHPSVAHAAFLANALRPKAKYVSVIGSYGWGGRMAEMIVGMVPNLKAEVLEPVLAKGLPRDKDFAALDRLAEQIRAKHVELV